MNADFLNSAVKTLQNAALPTSTEPSSNARHAAAPFTELFQDAAANLNSLENQASSTVEGLLGGSGVDVHAAMIATEKSDLAFETALAVRGKVVAAYQSMMGVQF